MGWRPSCRCSCSRSCLSTVLQPLPTCAESHAQQPIALSAPPPTTPTSHAHPYTRTQSAFGLGCSILFAYFCLAKPAREAEGDEGLSSPLLASSSTASLTALLTRRQHQQQASMLHLLATISKVLVAGMVAGVVGIGGGLLMAPMLLDAGIHPQVRTHSLGLLSACKCAFVLGHASATCSAHQAPACCADMCCAVPRVSPPFTTTATQQSTSATSNILVFMSSSSAALAFLLEGRVPLQYAAVFCSVCGAASLAGLTVVGRLVKASGRPSIVVLLLACIMGGGGLCSGVFGYLDAWRHAETGFQKIC